MPEILVVMAIGALVLVPLLTIARTAFDQEQSQTERNDRDAQLRVVASQITDDIRSGAPSDKRAGDPANELSLEFLDDRGDLQRVFWLSDAGTLRRIEMDGDSGIVTQDVVVLTGVATPGATFRYWRADGREITSGTDLASCAARVTVVLEIESDDGGTSTRAIDVAHRTTNEGADPCA